MTVSRGLRAKRTDAGKPKYDPEDYRDELERMTCEGSISAQEFIERSQPSSQWFRKHVMPICVMARCWACGRYFNPSKVGMMKECIKPRCPVALEKNRRNHVDGMYT